MKYIAALIALILQLSGNSVRSQETGGKIGLDFQVGSHIRRLGVMYQMFYYNNFIQVSQGIGIHFNFRSFGPKMTYPEAVINLAIQGLWGGSPEKESFLINEYSNMSPHSYSAGYVFYAFASGIGLSQTAGAAITNIGLFQFAIENDAFGLNPYDDKFRTGGIYVGYRLDSAYLGIQSTLWTGKSIDAPKIKDADYPSRHGYRDISKAKFGTVSHGILALRADGIWQYDQSLRFELGLDAERVRHIIQNKLTHDILLPLVVKSENPHYPMMARDGKMYLFRSGEKVKRPKPYIQLSTNQNAFY